MDDIVGDSEYAQDGKVDGGCLFGVTAAGVKQDPSRRSKGSER